MNKKNRIREVKGLLDLLEGLFTAYENNPNSAGRLPVTGVKSTLITCQKLLMEELESSFELDEDLSDCADILKAAPQAGKEASQATLSRPAVSKSIGAESPLTGRIRKVPVPHANGNGSNGHH